MCSFMCSPVKCIPPKYYRKCYVESYFLNGKYGHFIYHVLPKYNIQKYFISLSEVSNLRGANLTAAADFKDYYRIVSIVRIYS